MPVGIGILQSGLVAKDASPSADGLGALELPHRGILTHSWWWGGPVLPTVGGGQEDPLCGSVDSVFLPWAISDAVIHGTTVRRCPVYGWTS